MRGVSLVAAVGLLVLFACSSDESNEGPTTGTDAGADADVAANNAPPPGCVEDADSQSPDAAACLSDSYAIFVDGPGGLDTAAGSKAAPMKTIGAALAAAKASNKSRIYVCGSGDYAEALRPDFGVRIVGGHACGSWVFDGSRARIAPSLPGPVLTVDSVGALVSLSDLELRAPDVGEAEDGSSSIGIFGRKSNVRLIRVVVTAADGANGRRGADGIAGVYTNTTVMGSGDASAMFPGICTCSTSPVETAGGYGVDYGTTRDGTPDYPGPGGEGANGNGNRGADAPRAADAPPTTKLGELNDTGWQPAAGAASPENGKIGQAGGGGGCIRDAGGTCVPNTRGGGGGCGGCGGGPGQGGGGGGASLGLLLVESSVTLIDCTVFVGNGGNGGNGGAGAAGSPGGKGAGNTFVGGEGGRGADGGNGGGGPGGLSVAILFQGTPPSLDEPTRRKVASGKPGVAGKATAGNPGPAPEGKAGTVMDYGTL